MRRVRRALPLIGLALVVGVGGALLLEGMLQFIAEAAALFIVLIALIGPHRRRISTPPAPDTARQRPRPSIGHVTRRHVEPPSPRRTSRAWITFAEPRVSPPPGCRIRALRSCSPSRSTRRPSPDTNGVEEGKGYREALGPADVLNRYRVFRSGNATAAA